jgi:hypothetical protein
MALAKTKWCLICRGVLAGAAQQREVSFVPRGEEVQGNREQFETVQHKRDGELGAFGVGRGSANRSARCDDTGDAIK